VVAVALGALLGVLFTAISRYAASRVTPRDPMRGLAVVAIMMGVRFLISIAALGLYFAVARDGIVVFGLSMALSFVMGLGYEAVKLSSVRTFNTSA
jgi:hypothetical protein